MLKIDLELFGVPAFVLDVTADGSLRFAGANQAVLLATGLSASALIGRTIAECLPSAAAAPIEAHYRACVETRARREYDEEFGDEQPRWWRTTLQPAIDPVTGAVVRIVGVSVDITERKRVEKQLHDAANTDALTGVANRRRLKMNVEEAIKEAEHGGRPFGLIVMDLDGFKPINDTYGHQKGDDVLRHIASLLLLTARSNETVARVGGDEFAMLIRASTETELAGKITALRRFMDRSMSISDIEVSVGASIGGALWTGRQTFEELLTVADLEMYRQKGRRQERAA